MKHLKIFSLFSKSAAFKNPKKVLEKSTIAHDKNLSIFITRLYNFLNLTYIFSRKKRRTTEKF